MADYPSKMDSPEFQAMVAKLSKTKNDFLNSHNAFLRMLNKDRGREMAEQDRESLQPINHLKNGDDFVMWSHKLINTLKKVYLHNYLLMEIPEPGNEDEIEDWKKDRAAIMEYMRKSVPDDKVWTDLQGMGWDIKEQNPKATFDKLADYFYTDNNETNFLLYKEMVNHDSQNYDNFRAFYDRLVYLRGKLSQSEHWKVSDKAAIMCALKAVEGAHPNLYRRLIREARNNKLTWPELMVEFRKVADGQGL